MSRHPVLFSADGVPVDLLRAGEPRLSRASRRRTALATAAPVPARPPLLRLAQRLLPS